MGRIVQNSGSGLTIAFFGHDAADAAIRRRVKSFQDDGMSVEGYMMRRGEPSETAWRNHDLGQTKPGAFIHRAMSILTGTGRALKYRDHLAQSDLFYARNMDMLAIAVRVKRRLGLDVPIVYECLDVHRLLCRRDVIGDLFRNVERRLLRASSALIVSSPAFLEQHFERHYPGEYRPYLIENRLTDAFTGGARPQVSPSISEQAAAAPLRLGWVGVLRCQRSLDLLCRVAERLGPKIEIKLHGIPAETEVPHFHQQIAAHDNISFFGRYQAPEDLDGIYGGLDVVWAGDFMEAGFNSVWLLPNRIYEGGFFTTPAISPDGTQTAKWITDRNCGFTLAEPLEESLPQLLEQLFADRSHITAFSQTLSALPEDVFVQPAGLMRITLDRINSEHHDRDMSRKAASLRTI
jgi:succinoglycan biosynthesis protein ExoL